ncbi:MAG: RNA methyltransferase, partial [Eubacterium sp.]|nr:RNA methyltransferase [Eubacterium sp.]
MIITSRENEHIKLLRKLLGRSKARREEKCFVIEGINPVAEALKRGLARELVLSGGLKDSAGVFPEKVQELITEADRQSVVVTEVAKTLFDSISDTVTPQGVMAVTRMPEYDRRSVLSVENCKLLCLEDVRDPGNIGTIIRTAEGAGMDGILFSSGCADVYQPKVVRSTMGSVLRVPCFFCEGSMTDELSSLKKEDFTLYASHLQGSTDYRAPAYDGRIG